MKSSFYPLIAYIINVQQPNINGSYELKPAPQTSGKFWLELPWI